MNHRKNYLFDTIVLFLLMVAQIPSAKADENVKPSIDVTQYRDANQNAYMEICYSLPESGIRYIANETGQFECQVILDIQVYLDETLWANKVWKIEKSLADTTEITQNSQIVDLIRYTVSDPGTYRIKMHVRDMNRSGSVDSSQTEFTVREFSEDEVDISGVQFASKIRKATPEAASIFVKNNYEVIPVPAGIFGEGVSSLYYYFEAYNLFDNVKADKYKSICKLEDNQGRVVEGVGNVQRTKKKRFDSSVEVGMINIATLPSGRYTLNYGIADVSDSLLVKDEKVFFIYNPSIPIARTDVGNDLGPLANFGEEQLDDEFRRMVYITTSEDRELYKNLRDIDGKQKFVFDVWNRPHEDFNVVGLELRQLYLARARYADENFHSVFHPGWRSDRGRVFVLYGPPTTIERFPSLGESIPYQIWTYDELKGQGSVEFIFGDRTNLGKYELLHSDLRGELQNPDWQREIARGSGEFEFR